MHLFNFNSRTSSSSSVSHHQAHHLPSHRHHHNLARSSRSNSMDPVEIWSDVKAVAFDVDSTVTIDEAIDELAKFLGCAEQVTSITREAMDEGLDFTESLQRRLTVMQPSAQDVEHFLRVVPLRLTKNIEMIVERLVQAGVQVFLITGGFDLLVRRVAQAINVPWSNVYCNRFVFNPDGTFHDFDRTCLTSRSGGKGEAVTDIMKRLGNGKVIIIGDGMTDAEASPPAHSFVGFGGNVERPAVRQRAEFYVHTMKDLSKLFEQKLLFPPVPHNQYSLKLPF